MRWRTTNSGFVTRSESWSLEKRNKQPEEHIRKMSQIRKTRLSMVPFFKRKHVTVGISSTKIIKLMMTELYYAASVSGCWGPTCNSLSWLIGKHTLNGPHNQVINYDNHTASASILLWEQSDVFVTINWNDVYSFSSDRWDRECHHLFVSAVMTREMTVVTLTLTELAHFSFNAEASLHSLIDFLFLSN